MEIYSSPPRFDVRCIKYASVTRVDAYRQGTISNSVRICGLPYLTYDREAAKGFTSDRNPGRKNVQNVSAGHNQRDLAQMRKSSE